MIQESCFNLQKRKQEKGIRFFPLRKEIPCRILQNIFCLKQEKPIYLTLEDNLYYEYFYLFEIKLYLNSLGFYIHICIFIIHIIFCFVLY